MRINTFLVDDEEHSIEVSMHYLSKYCPNVNVVGQANNIKDAVAKISQLKVDLVLLDMNLKNGELGFDLVKAMPEANFKIIVISAHSEYGIHAVKHNVYDYLLKPLNPIELVEAMEKVIQQTKIAPANMGKLAVSEKSGIKLINIEEIKYLEADGNYTYLHFDGNKEVITMRIGEIIEKLPEKYFHRIHRTYVVNIQSVRSLVKKGKYLVILMDQTELPISRAVRTNFQSTLEDRTNFLN